MICFGLCLALTAKIVVDMHVQCPECPKALTQRSELTYHIRRAHTGEKPFACDVCEYSCATSGNLAQHKRSKARMRAVAAVEDASSHTGIGCVCVLCVSLVMLGGMYICVVFCRREAGASVTPHPTAIGYCSQCWCCMPTV